jgi:hypothetical protein
MQMKYQVTLPESLSGLTDEQVGVVVAIVESERDALKTKLTRLIEAAERARGWIDEDWVVAALDAAIAEARK